MNSQFSIGFVIALVLGVAIGAAWPKYESRLLDTAMGRGQGPRQVSYAQASGEQGVGACERSHDGAYGQCAGKRDSGRGRGGRGDGGGCSQSRGGSAAQCSGTRNAEAGQMGRRCSGGCEKPSDDLSAQCEGATKSGRVRGRRGGATRTVGRGNGNGNGRGDGNGNGRGNANGRGRGNANGRGHGERQTVSTDFAATKTCQDSGGRGSAKGKCSHEAAETDRHETLAQNRERCNASTQQLTVDDSTAEAEHPEERQRGRGRDGQHFAGQGRGFGLGMGLGLGGGHGWTTDADPTDASDAEDTSGVAEND